MKKKTKLLSLISTTLAGLALSLGVVSGVSYEKTSVETNAYYSPSTHYEVSDTASELASYYSSISDSDTGTSLLSKLQSLNSTKRKKTMGYSGVGTDTSGAFIYTDYDLNNTAKDSSGQTYGTKIASFYTKTSATSWNREHVWPNSHGGDKVEGDILHTRPTISSENSSRGNSFYVEGKNSSSAGWDPYTAGYDIECRGECARIILYSVVAYSGFSLSALDSHSTSNANPDYMMGNMHTLIKWHFDYAPNVYEINRNNGAEYLQGNRNPFVDHPEYAARIWSSFDSTVSTLCTNNSSKYENWTPGNYCNYGSNTPVTPNVGVTISSSTASVSVGSTTSLSATSTDSGTITWTTSNSSVASISSSTAASGASITITGVAAGTATITAKRTISGTEYSQTCTVTVTKVVSSLSAGSTTPTKTTYTAGESFDPTGLTITANYSDSTSSNVTSSVVWSPDPLTAGTTSVTGTYGGKSITITGLTVNAATEPEIIDSNSDLSVGDYVVLRTAAGVGVTGWNNNKDATVSETESSWKKFYVASASSSGFTLKDETANSFIANPGSSNQFTYGSAATCSTDSSGHLICNSRYLCKNGTNYRFYSSVGSYLPFFIYKVPASSTKTLSSISVSTAPTKTTYTAGEYFDPTGLVITRTYSDSTSDTYTYANHTSEFTFSPTTSTALTISNVSVSITYGGKSCSQAITVNAAKTLSSISVSTAPTKTTYTVGEYFDPTGLVITRTYSDSTSDTYTYANHTSEFTFSPSTSTALTTSNASVTITYGGKSTTQAITVNAKTLSSISVSTAPTKTTYTAGEYFDPTGLVITRTYSDSTYDTYTYSGHTSEFTFSPSTSTALTTSNASVTITYSGKSCSQAITVNAAAKTLSSITISGYTTSFTLDDTFSFGGTVTANFSDSSTSNVTSSATFSGYNMSVAGNYTVTVSYTYGGTTKTTTYQITVASSGGGGQTEVDSEIVDLNAQGYSNTEEVASASANYSTVEFAKNDGSNAPKYYTSGSAVRLYPSNTLVISSDRTIIEITFTFGSSDGSNSITSSPSGFSSPTWSGSANSVTFTIGGTNGNRRIASIEITYEESGSVEPATSITATSNKTFYVGETISSSDLTVKDNNNKTVTGFSFANDGYQFTYPDAASGGTSTSKTFTNAVSYSSLTCSLTVQVQRKAYSAPTGTQSLEHTGAEFSTAGIGSSYTEGQSATVDGIPFSVDGYIYSSKLSLSSSKTSAPGKVVNTAPYPSGITNVTVSGASPDIQLSTDGSTWVNLASAQTSTTNYYYLKLYYSNTTQTNYVNITSFTVTMKAFETPENVANYIMFEDTNNQCVSKLPIALDYYKNLSASGKSEFQTSDDYVISTARERLTAWAEAQGKTINYSTGELSNSRIGLSNILGEESSEITIVVVFTSISVSSLLFFLILKRKRMMYR